jgi:high-affinity nickel-transport protein
MLPVLGVTLLTSLLWGMRHATDADHVVAVSTIVSRERSVWRAALIGAQWGLGHTLTVVTVGGAIILFKLAVTPRLGLSMEFAVALMLIALGVMNMAGSRGGAAPARLAFPPVLVGLVHGMAGSAAASVIVMALIPEPRWAMAALAVFCLGTMLGMALVTAAVALPSAYAGARLAGLERRLRFAAGALSALFGVYLAHQIGFVDGLFTAAPRWDPR